jgi:beta-galactosidase
MYFGVDYYPEHWPLDWLEKDLDNFVQLGANTLRIGEFAWHLMEPTPGKYDFSYFDRVIEEAAKRDFKIIFGTPTATFPAWLAYQSPEILSVDAFGHQRVFGGRRQYCYNSKIYELYASRFVQALVMHYADCKTIIAWQIDNEFGHEGSDDCYCPQCNLSWHGYLKKKYENIDSLNEDYGTVFWGQTYNGFEEIPMPTATITTHNPSLKLDWARFRSVSLNQFAIGQVDLVRDYKGEHQKVIHNFYGGFFERKYDQNVLAEMLDVVAYDNYPVWGGLRKPISPAHIAMTLDYNHGLKQQNFWIVEQLMGAQGHDVIGYRPRPGQGRLWSWQAMTRGCESLLYFRERTMTRGQEQYCQGLIDADNRNGEKYYEAAQFFKEAKEVAMNWKPLKPAKVAILYGYDNIRSWHEQPQSEAMDFTNEFMRFYEGFHQLNVPVDVLDLEKDFSEYQVVVLPVMQIMTPDLENRLKTFVKKGGVLLATFRCGIKDEHNNLKLGEVVPGGLTDLFGCEVFGYESLYEGLALEVKGSLGDGFVEVWRDLLQATTAEILLTYQDESYKNYAAATSHSYGEGTAIYIGAALSNSLVDALCHKICEASHIQMIHSPQGLEVVQREMNNGRLQRIVLNHTESPLEFEGQIISPYDVVFEECMPD